MDPDAPERILLTFNEEPAGQYAFEARAATDGTIEFVPLEDEG
jgi:hypothetical protein